MASILLFGIPQGAHHYIKGVESAKFKPSFKNHLLFYCSYLILLFLTGGLWYFNPVAGIVLVLILSLVQYGRADMTHFLIPGMKPYSAYLGRGILVLGLILFSSPAASFAIISDAMRTSLSGLRHALPDSEWLLVLIAVIYIISLVPALYKRQIHSPLLLLFDSFLLIATIWSTGFLMGLALYIALWYSAGQIVETQKYFHSKGKPLSLGRFYLKAIPFTLVSLIGLAALTWFHQTYSIQNEFFSLLFILITVLIFPYGVILEKIDQPDGTPA